MTRMVLFAVVLITAMIAAVYGLEPVYFADPDLRVAVEKQLGIRGPNATDMLALTSLSRPYLYTPPAIDDLTGLEYAANLTKLSLSRSIIGDVSTLSKLTNLTELKLQDNSISDISSLSGLTNLKKLWLSKNQITNISALSGLKNLTSLALSHNQINDISALSQLTSLTDLWLTDNQITDISVLSGLTNLTKLCLQNNRITNISALSGLTTLTILRLDNNQLTDVSALSGLTSLRSLELSDNQIAAVPPLMQMKNLQSLYLHNNQLTDISGLSGLTNLRYLWLNNNDITNISALSALTENLRYLHLENNRIKDISVLPQLADLRNVELDGNPLNAQAYSNYMPKIIALNPPKGYRHPDLTPPPLPNAIARADNDYVFEKPYENQGSERVELPEPVWEKICEVTLRRFNSRYYEDLTKFSDLFGPVFQIRVPDYENLHLYVYKIEGIGTGRGSLWLMLYDCHSGKVTPEPRGFSGQWMYGSWPGMPISKPFVDFNDLNLDGNPEVVFKERIHNGTELNAIVHHFLRISGDLSLLPIFRLEVRSYHHCFNNCFITGRPGYLIRAIEKQKSNRILVRVSVSAEPFKEGKMKVGHVVLESINASSPFTVKEQIMYLKEEDVGRWYGTYAKLLLHTWLSPYRSQ